MAAKAIFWVMLGIFLAGATLAYLSHAYPKSSTASQRSIALEIRFPSGAAAHDVPIEFTLQNPLSRPLRVFDIETSCNCTTAQLCPKEIPPGENVPITARVSVIAIETQKHISCVVITDDPGEPRKRFTASINVVTELHFSQNECDFGPMKVGESKSMNVNLEVSSEAKTMPRVNLSCSSPGLTARMLGGEPLLQQSTGTFFKWRIPVVVTLRREPALSDFPLSVVGTARVDGRECSTELNCRWHPKREFVVYPSRAILKKPGKNPSTSECHAIQVRRIDGSRFRVLSVQTMDNFVEASIQEHSDRRLATLHIVLRDAAPVAGRYLSTVELETDSMTEPTIRVPIVVLID